MTIRAQTNCKIASAQTIHHCWMHWAAVQLLPAQNQKSKKKMDGALFIVWKPTKNILNNFPLAKPAGSLAELSCMHKKILKCRRTVVVFSVDLSSSQTWGGWSVGTMKWSTVMSMEFPKRTIKKSAQSVFHIYSSQGLLEINTVAVLLWSYTARL